MRNDHNQIDDPVVIKYNCVLILIGKKIVMIVILIMMLVVGKREKRRKIHSLILVSFSTHQGVYLYVVVVHTVASNSRIGWLVFKCAWRRDEWIRQYSQTCIIHEKRTCYTFLSFFFRWVNCSNHASHMSFFDWMRKEIDLRE